MPNPPKPTELKRRQGNPGKRSLKRPSAVTVLPRAEGAPEPLRPLGQEGLRMWERIWTSGGVWVSERTDIELVQLTCEAMDERIALRVAVLRGADWRDRVALRTLERSIVAMLSQLGFSPVDRTRMGAAEVAPVSKLQQLRERQERRKG